MATFEILHISQPNGTITSSQAQKNMQPHSDIRKLPTLVDKRSLQTKLLSRLEDAPLKRPNEADYRGWADVRGDG